MSLSHTQDIKSVLQLHLLKFHDMKMCEGSHRSTWGLQRLFFAMSRPSQLHPVLAAYELIFST